MDHEHPDGVDDANGVGARDSSGAEPPRSNDAQRPRRRVQGQPCGGMTPRESAEPIAPATTREIRHRRIYWTPTTKYLVSLAFALLWAAGSAWIARWWAADIGQYVTLVGGWIVVVLVAILPGFVVSLMGMSLALDKQPAFRNQQPDTPLTIIIAAHNEEAGMRETIVRIANQDYRGPIRIIVANNNSTDATAQIALDTALEFGSDLSVIFESTPGKSHALNRALEAVTTPYVATVDADTLLHPQAVRRLVSRMESGPGHVVAVAGSVLVGNSRASFLTRMQEWDYWIGIAGVKRMQGLYSATLVAQGAFSVYDTVAVRAIGGWPDAIGEDIVVTWRLMADGSRVLFEPTAVAFTDAPTNVRHFMRQRARWARGMFEGLRSVPPWKQRTPLAKAVVSIDLLIPFLDVGYALLWLPGVVLFLFGIPIIVSLWTLIVLPITLVMYGTMRYFQSTRVFRPLGLRVRKNRLGYIAFFLLYQSLCSVASLIGYAQYLLGSQRRWK